MTILSVFYGITTEDRPRVVVRTTASVSYAVSADNTVLLVERHKRLLNHVNEARHRGIGGPRLGSIQYHDSLIDQNKLLNFKLTRLTRELSEGNGYEFFVERTFLNGVWQLPVLCQQAEDRIDSVPLQLLEGQPATGPLHRILSTLLTHM